MSIERAYRVLATGFCFAAFGLGGLLLSLVVLPFLRPARARVVISRSFRLFVATMRGLRVLDLNTAGLDGLCAERGTIVVANHPTLIDVVLLLAHLDHATCVVKRALWSNPFLGGVVRAAGYIPNDGHEEVLAACERALADGDTLVIFPEGTRTRPNAPLQLKRGAAAIALHTGAAVRLVHIRCNPSTLTKAERWYQVPATRPTFSLQLGNTVRTERFVAADMPVSRAARRLTAVLEEELTKGAFADA